MAGEVWSSWGCAPRRPGTRGQLVQPSHRHSEGPRGSTCGAPERLLLPHTAPRTAAGDGEEHAAKGRQRSHREGTRSRVQPEGHFQKG